MLLSLLLLAPFFLSRRSDNDAGIQWGVFELQPDMMQLELDLVLQPVVLSRFGVD